MGGGAGKHLESTWQFAPSARECVDMSMYTTDAFSLPTDVGVGDLAGNSVGLIRRAVGEGKKSVKAVRSLASIMSPRLRRSSSEPTELRLGDASPSLSDPTLAGRRGRLTAGGKWQTSPLDAG